jgi:hypothetical protein
MNDTWKIWQFITPREGILGLLLLFVASVFIHVMVFTLSDRFLDAYLGLNPV